MEVLRKIYGPTRENKGRRIKYNYELCDFYTAPEIVTSAKVGRLKWLGKLARTNETSTCRKLLPSQKVK
jgi:hypothetical protein